MFTNREFTQEEFIPFIGIVFTVAVIVVAAYFSKDYRKFWSPLTILAVIFAYYCVLGPYQAVDSGDTYDRLKNMRPHYVSALWGALVALLSFVAGFQIMRRHERIRSAPVITNDQFFRYGRNLFLIGFGLFTVSTGGAVTKLINPLDAEYVQTVGGSFGNYFGLSLNFVIPAITMLFLYYLLERKKMLWFIIPLVICMGIFVTLGFRYRLVLLLGALVITYFYVKGTKPNIVLSLVGIVTFIGLMGIINISRKYGSGLDLQKLENRDTQGYYKSGLRESLIFQTSGAVIDLVPERHPYAGFDPLISTIVFPIPSALYPGKQSAEYLFNTLDEIYGKKISKGSAMMSYGEYYLAFGWTGIVLGYFLLGWLFRRLWDWYLGNALNPLAIAVYAVSVTYLYVVISRGYLPQVTMLFFFTVFPIFYILRLAKKKAIFNRLRTV